MKDYIKPNNWSLIEEGFDKNKVEASESLFSIGNGIFGQRANFEEQYSGKTLQGNYIGGIYYEDKTRVGWWKNGYPEYFAKVLNAPNWIGIKVRVNGEELDLNTIKVSNFRRELNMKEGYLQRSFTAHFKAGKVEILSTRFLSLDINELGAIKYDIKPINFDAELEILPYLDGGIKNEDSNYDELFWEVLNIESSENEAYILSKTKKTDFYVSTGMKLNFLLNNKEIVFLDRMIRNSEKNSTFSYKFNATANTTLSTYKYGGYVSSLNCDKDNLIRKHKTILKNATEIGFEKTIR